MLGGGVVPGSLTLIGGDPGVGKSTLLLQLAGILSQPLPAPGPDQNGLQSGVENGAVNKAAHGAAEEASDEEIAAMHTNAVLYVSAEESVEQVGTVVYLRSH